MFRIKKNNSNSFKPRGVNGFRVSDEISLMVIFLIIIIVASILLPRFRTLENLLTVTRQFSIISLVAMGEALVMITGCFDLSVGTIAALSGMVASNLMVEQGLPVWFSIIIGISVGILCGAINGILITKVKIQPLITTLATSWIFAGIMLIVWKGWPTIDMPDSFWILGQGKIFGIPNPIIIMIIVAIILSIFLTRTVYGRYLYAVGGNRKASILAGLNSDRVTITAFAIGGALAALAGIVLASRLASSQATNGQNWPLPAIAAAVIGGVSLSGGKGKIYGVIIGVALLGIINNILLMFGVSSYWNDFVSGFIVIIAVSIDSIRKRREGRRKSLIIKSNKTK